jgi:hypothetical protein
MLTRTRAPLGVGLGIAGLCLSFLAVGCATRGKAARGVASQELNCDEADMKVEHEEGRFYRATGCGGSVRIACYDPYESTGAQWAPADPATAGNRVRCERILDAQPSLTNANVAAASSAPSSSSSSSSAHAPSGANGNAKGFDVELARKLLNAAADRAKTCAAPSGPTGQGSARISFGRDGTVAAVEVAPPFSDTEVGRCVAREFSRLSVTPYEGEPVTVKKAFDIAR